MAKIVLISCASKKLSYKSRARDLYVSPLFEYCFRYANLLRPDKVFILSAKYGLLDPSKKVKPYNQTLNKMSVGEVRRWANGVASQLSEVFNINKDEFIFLAGERYRKHLMPHITHYKVPMKGLGIGKQLQFLKRHVK